jgi:hypothetical protein
MAQSVSIEPNIAGVQFAPRAAIRFKWMYFLALSAVIAVSFGFRHIAAVIISGRTYTPFIYNSSAIRHATSRNFSYLPDDIVWDETWAYAPMVQGLLRGNAGDDSFDSYGEYLSPTVKSNESGIIRKGFGEYLIAALAIALNHSVPNAFVAADFVFPLIAAACFLVVSFTLRPTLSFASAATAFVLFFNWRDIRNQLEFLRGAHHNSSMFLRTPYPQLAIPSILILILCLLWLLRNPTLIRSVALAIALSVNCFTYFYAWTFAYAFLAAAAIAIVAGMRWKTLASAELAGAHPGRALRYIALSCSIATLASYPIWVLALDKTATVRDLFVRTQGQVTHRPDTVRTTLLFCLLAACVLWKVRGGRVLPLLPLTLTASILILNVQIVAGRTIQANHWTAYFTQPLLQLCLINVIWQFFENRGWSVAPRVIAGGLMILGLFTNGIQYWTAALEAQNYQHQDHSFEELVTTLNSPTLLNYGFVTNDVYLSSILPAYVPLKPLMPKYIDPLSDEQLSQLRLAAAEATGFETWMDYSIASGNLASPMSGVRQIHYLPARVAIILNLHRAIGNPPRKCTLLHNSDFAVLAPCE